jgi:quercetin dioxygenase-like cupin family protein
MFFRLGLAGLVAFALLRMPAIAEPLSENSASTLLATGHLASVVELPMFLRLYRAHLPAAQHASYQGAIAMLYELSGTAMIEIGGAAARPFPEGAGAFIAAGQEATISAAEAEPTDLLVFLLTARPNQGRRLLSRPAIVQELFRTPDPLPGLKEGPYEFSLLRLTFPPGMPPDPPHSRAGAALDYVLAGTGAASADGKTETGSPGMALFEGFGWVHSLANPGETPFVLLQANISREGEPAVHPAAGK